MAAGGVGESLRTRAPPACSEVLTCSCEQRLNPGEGCGDLGALVSEVSSKSRKELFKVRHHLHITKRTDCRCLTQVYT